MVVLSPLHPAQLRVTREASRFNTLSCGRRFGKTILGEDRLIHPAIQGYPVAWFSPTYSMLTEVWRAVRQMLLPITATVDKQQHRIDLYGGGVIDMWSLDSVNAPRGRKYGRVVIDEAAMVPHLEEAWNAVIRPTLADYRGDAWFLSTPVGRNFFWRLYQRGQDSDEPDWASWQMSSYENPYIERGELDALRSQVPDRTYRQEILAEFLEDGGGVFRRVIDCVADVAQAGPLAGHTYALGVDWGRTNDFTALAVMDVGERALVALDRFTDIDFEIQFGRLTALVERFRPVSIIAERNSFGLPMVERCQRAGMRVEPWEANNANKAAVIQALALAFEQGQLRILNDPILIGELQAYDQDRTATGLIRYGAPSGMHDDTVIALALAWQACSQPAPVITNIDRPPLGGTRRLWGR